MFTSIISPRTSSVFRPSSGRRPYSSAVKGRLAVVTVAIAASIVGLRHRYLTRPAARAASVAVPGGLPVHDRRGVRLERRPGDVLTTSGCRFGFSIAPGSAAAHSGGYG